MKLQSSTTTKNLSRLVVVFLLSFTLSGCPSWIANQTTVEDQEDPELQALRAVTLELREIPPLDLSEYKGIRFMVVEDRDGTKWVTLQYSDYEKLSQLLVEIRNYIKNQKAVLEEVERYYQESIERREDDTEE